MAKPQPPRKPSSSARQAKARAAGAAGRPGVNRIVIAAVVAVVVIATVVGVAIWMNERAKKEAAGSGREVPAGARMGVGYRIFPEVTPKPGAPTIDLYEDFQCPICGQFEAAVGKDLQQAAKQGRVVLRYNVMKFLDDKAGSSFSVPVANGAFCAAEQGRFIPFHDAAYAGQQPEGSDVGIDILEGYAKQAGIAGAGLERWKACTQAGKYTAYVSSVDEAGGKIEGFSGTPSALVNGKLVNVLKEMMTPQGVEAVIAANTKK